MTYQTITVARQGDVAIICLNDPKTLNALTIQMIDELRDALVETRGWARAMLLAGTGRAFCSGANLSSGMGLSADATTDAGLVLETHINPLLLELRDLPCPWISAVSGSAAGVGCSLALSADMIIAGESAFFLQAFAKIGLVPDGGSTWLLTRALGRARAMQMMLLAERIPAAKALEWGLINAVVRDDFILPAALELAATIAAGPTVSMSLMRSMAWAASDRAYEECIVMERANQRIAGESADFREGVSAFLAKRAPHFTGK